MLPVTVMRAHLCGQSALVKESATYQAHVVRLHTMSGHVLPHRDLLMRCTKKCAPTADVSTHACVTFLTFAALTYLLAPVLTSTSSCEYQMLDVDRQQGKGHATHLSNVDPAKQFVGSIVCQKLAVIHFQCGPAARLGIHKLLDMCIDGHLHTAHPQLRQWSSMQGAFHSSIKLRIAEPRS